MQDLRVKVGNVTLQIRLYEQEGDTIIFLHFGGANLMMWQGVIPYFQEQYRLILVDLRGHGKSDEPETGYHIDEMAQDVVGIMKFMGIKSAHIVGSSLGAEVGLSMSANYPEKVTSLVCDGALYSEYGPYGLWEGSEAEFRTHVTNRLEKVRNTPESEYPSIDALVEARRQALEEYILWNEEIEAMERYNAHKMENGNYTRGWHKQTRECYMENYFEYRFEEYYKRVKCPVLMVPGEEEAQDERTRTVMEGLKELCRGTIVEVNGWAHPYGWLLDAEEMSKTILKFLAGDAVRNFNSDKQKS